MSVAVLRPVPARAAGRGRGVRGSIVFVGGYAYDPFWGPGFWGAGPWYPYPYPYSIDPLPYDPSADMRILATPKDAKVYVDGYYVGLVDDFDGVFQHLSLPPGGHDITLYREGYRTVTRQIYLQPAHTFKLREQMAPVAPGEASAPPPAPPASAAPPPPEEGAPGEASNFGALSIHVQPADAEVLIDGERWDGTPDRARLIVQVADGRHHVEIRKDGYRPYEADVDVRRGETRAVNVSLSRE